MVFSALVGATFNPWQAFQAIAQSAGQVWVCLARFVTGAPAAAMYGLRLPVEGQWLVVNGGVTEKESHSWRVVAQRFAYDLAVRAAADKTYTGAGALLTDYPAYGRSVVAAADGEVVSVVDGIPDHTRPGTGAVDWTARDIRGNHIVIKHGDRLYSMCGHLQPRSCTLRPGDVVRRGDPIGRCGNSGHSTEPHLHFHIQDRANFYLSAGVAPVFEKIEITDAKGDVRLTEHEAPRKGEQASDQGPSVRPPAPGPRGVPLGVGDFLFSMWILAANVVSFCTVWYLLYVLARAVMNRFAVS